MDKRCERHTWIVCITYSVLTCDEIGLEQFMIINNYDKKNTNIYNICTAKKRQDSKGISSIT